MKQQPHLRLFGIPKLAGYLPGYGKLLFAMVFFGTLGSVMDVVIPLFQQYAIDHFIADGAMNGLGGFLALYVLVMLVQTASNYISAYGAICRRFHSRISTRTASAMSMRASCPTPTASRARSHGA